jgi:hypothetical protein
LVKEIQVVEPPRLLCAALLAVVNIIDSNAIVF